MPRRPKPKSKAEKKAEMIFIMKHSLELEKSQDALKSVLNQIVDYFRNFVDEFHKTVFSEKLKFIFYSVLKTEGEIFMQLQQYDYAIKCFKTMKDYCLQWGHMEHLRMRMYEHISLCYYKCSKF